MFYLQDEYESDESEEQETAGSQPGAFVRPLPAGDSEEESDSDEEDEDKEEEGTDESGDDDLLPIEKANNRLKKKQEKERYVH